MQLSPTSRPVSAFRNRVPAAAGLIAAALLLGTGPLAAQSEAELVEQGQAIFEDARGAFGCADCHGQDPTLMVAPTLSAVEYNEVHAALLAFAEMGSFDLDADEEEAVAAYLASLDDPPETDSVDPMVAVGRYIFESGGGRMACTDCHGQDPVGTVAPQIGGESVQEMHDAITSLDDPSFMALTDTELRAVAAYLDSRAGQD